LATSPARAFARTVVVVAAVLAACLVSIALTWVVYSQLQLILMRGLYDELVAETEAAEYRRSPDPPGWELQPGSAAELYQQAVETCPPGQRLASLNVQDLNRTLRAMRWDQLPAERRRDLTAPGSQPLPHECVQAGVPADVLDPALAQLTRDECQALLDCETAFDLLLEGSRRQDTLSPRSIWSSWGTNEVDGFDLELQIGVMLLTKLWLVHGHVQQVSGVRQGWIDASCGVLRFSGDETRGAGYLPGLISLSQRQAAAEFLWALLERADLDAADSRQLARELSYINSQPLDHGDMLRGDVVTGIAMMGWTRDGDPVPPSVRGSMALGPVTLRERLMLTWGMNVTRKTWRGALDQQDLAYPERLAAYDRMNEDQGSFPAQLQGIAHVYAGTDARIALSNTYLELLELAAAASAVRGETGVAPGSLDALLSHHPDLPQVDRFTGDSYEIALDGDRCVIASPAAHPSRREEAGFDRLPNVDPDQRLVLTIPAAEGP